MSAPGVGIWEIAEVWRVIPGKLVYRHTLTHHLQPVFVMEQASMQGQHDDARDDCSCHSSMLAGGPERRGDKGWKVLALVFGREKKKNCLARNCRYISSGRNDKKKNNTFHGVIHLSNVPGPKPISKSFPFSRTTSAPHLIYHFLSLCSLLFYPSLNDSHICCHSAVPFSHLDSSAVFGYTRWKGARCKDIWNGSQILSHFDNVCKIHP